MFLLKTAFSISHSRGSRWRRLTCFPVNSAAVVAMLVKLLFVLIASNTSPATSLVVSFSRSKYALCCKRFSLLFPPFFCSLFLCVIVDLSQCKMETSFSGLLVLLRLLDVFRGAPLLVLELPEKIWARRLPKGFWSMVFSISWGKRGKRQNGYTRTWNATPLLRVARSKS